VTIEEKTMLPSEPHEINISSARFFIATRSTDCRNCGLPTLVIAIALPAGHQTLDAEAATDPGSRLTGADSWQVAAVSAFIFYVEYLPDAVRRLIGRLSSSYKLGHSESMEFACWVNHCEHCESLQDDHELFCEPGGAFTPISEREAAAIVLIAIETPFEASAAGYAYQPEFFEFMRRA
jgi:hypothetical protein